MIRTATVTAAVISVARRCVSVVHFCDGFYLFSASDDFPTTIRPNQDGVVYSIIGYLSKAKHFVLNVAPSVLFEFNAVCSHHVQ